MTMGSVLEPGPETNCVTTRSSQDSVKASSQPDMIAGRMSGSVIRKNTFAGRAPRSIAASSRESSKRRQSRLNDHRDVGHREGDVGDGDRRHAAVELPAEHPLEQLLEATNSSSIDRPVMTSGMTSGAVVRPVQQRPSLERTEPREHQARERAEDHGAGGRHRGDLDRQPRRRQHLFVPRTARRTTWSRIRGPHGHEARLVERVDDHQQDRQVQEREAEDQHRCAEYGRAPFISWRPAALCSGSAGKA